MLQQRIPEAIGTERVWMRSLRHAVIKMTLGAYDHARRGAIRCVIGGAMWPSSRKSAVGYDDSDKRQLCDENVVGSLGHQ
eukprot:5285725-Pyramimonas_sp.AAC.1